jgi:hypothetical protein
LQAVAQAAAVAAAVATLVAVAAVEDILIVQYQLPLLYYTQLPLALVAQLVVATWLALTVLIQQLVLWSTVPPVLLAEGGVGQLVGRRQAQMVVQVAVDKQPAAMAQPAKDLLGMEDQILQAEVEAQARPPLIKMVLPVKLIQ